MKSVFVMWQDSTGTRMWHPVAKLTQQNSCRYVLSYTKGAQHEKFSFFPNMQDISKSYTSDRLFSFFRNRLIPESRPEHDNMFEWSGLSSHSKDYLELLAISGGEKKTDHFRIVNLPKNEDGFYRIKFFISSINYLNEIEKTSITSLQPNDRLKYQFDENNLVDVDATILLKEDNVRVGYLPHYLCKDLKKLLNYLNEDDIQIKVLKVNLDAPSQFKVLCELKAPWPENFNAFNDEEFSSYE
ncbi:HipA N-terminal domain-containing protein [Acinetobacter calcoaceticus]